LEIGKKGKDMGVDSARKRRLETTVVTQEAGEGR